MKDLREAITEKEAEIARLRAELETLRKAASILASNGNGAGNKRPLMSMTLSQVEADQPTTHPGMAEAVLREGSKPLHLSAIVQRIQERFNRQVSRTSLSTILYKYAQRNHLFYKSPDAANTYGLLEWNRRTISAQETMH
jgi:hypothetical protein